MPPKKSAAAAKPATANTKAPAKKAASTVSTTSKATSVKASKRKAESEIESEVEAPKAKKAKPTPAASKTTAAAKRTSTKPATTKAPAKAAAKKVSPKAAAVEKASESESDEEPETKTAKTTKASKAAPKKAAAKKVTKPAAATEDEEEDDEDEESAEEAPKAKVPAKKAAASKAKAPAKAPASKKSAAPEASKAPAAKKAAAPKTSQAKSLPTLNSPPTTILDVFVFGEGGSGELGLGARKGADGKKVLDVTRPRLNPLLSAKDVGVVALAVGGMHCAVLTHDNKILTWGVNDQGTLGRPTPQEGKMKDLPAAGEDADSDSDSDDDDSGLNPSEAEPRQVDPARFPDGTTFASVYAGDSCTFALTTTGLVYGWGTFRGNDGVIGFRNGVKVQSSPMLIPELKDITRIAVGTNHVLALNKKGKVFTWGAGEQSQLARRVVSRTAAGALVPREFGLQRKKIAHIGAGDYHSFAVDDNGDVYSWGLNSFGQTGVPKEEETNEDAIGTPTLVKSLAQYKIKQLAGGAHHTLACTEAGEVLVWGRVDNCEGGMEIKDMPQENLYFDETSKQPRFLIKPAVIPDINGSWVATGNDTCIAVDTKGKAYSWGFSTNFQTGQGTSDDVTKATMIDNTAVAKKKLVWAGVGGQFGVVAGVHEDTEMTNGI